MIARIFVLGLALCATAPAATAAPITTLHSTGQAAGGAADPHYTITAVSGVAYTPGAATVFSTLDGSYPISAGVWALNADTPAAGYPTDSKWIGPSANANQNWLHSIWTYQTTFDLTGLDPASAEITGAVAADNDVTVFLNGVQTDYFFFSGDRGYTAEAFKKQTFAPTSGFVPGENTLTFVVRNGNTTNDINAPTGLRVALEGTALPTPEPASAAALGVGVLAVARYIRRRRVTG